MVCRFAVSNAGFGCDFAKNRWVCAKEPAFMSTGLRLKKLSIAVTTNAAGLILSIANCCGS